MFEWKGRVGSKSHQSGSIFSGAIGEGLIYKLLTLTLCGTLGKMESLSGIEPNFIGFGSGFGFDPICFFCMLSFFLLANTNLATLETMNQPKVRCLHLNDLNARSSFESPIKARFLPFRIVRNQESLRVHGPLKVGPPPRRS